MTNLNFTFRDASGVIQTALSTDDGTGKHIPKHELTAGEAHVGKIGGQLVQVTTEFTRPADTTAYAANDVVSHTTTPTSVIQLTSFFRTITGSGYVVGAKLITDKKSITPRFRVHLYNNTIPAIAGDNLPYKEVYSDEFQYLSYFDLVAMYTPADTSGSSLSKSQDMNLRIPVVANGSDLNLYYVLETLDIFTPANAEKFSLTLFGDLN